MSPANLRRFILLAGVALPMSAQAEEDTPQRDYLGEDIVVTGTLDGYVGTDGASATRTPTPIIDVPQTMTVITSDQLEDQATTDLGEALRFVPGISHDTGEGHRDEVYIRGQRTTADFYLDGLRDDGQYYRSLYNIERVEVLKGANALIFGRGAGGGAINRVGRVARFDASAYNLSAQADTFGAFALAADANLPASDTLAFRLMGTYEEFGNHRDLYEGRFFGITPTLTARLGPDTRLTATYSYDDDSRVTDRGVPSRGGLPIAGFDETFFGDADYNQSETQTHVARARLEHDLSDAWALDAQVQFADYDKYYGNIVPGAATATTVSLSGYDSSTDRQNLIGMVNLVGEFATGGVGHTLLIGAEATLSDTEATRTIARFNNNTTTSVTVPLAERIAVPAFVIVPQRASTSNLATLSAYVQDQIDIGPVQIVAGLRYDRFDIESTDIVANFDGARVDERVSPRLGVIVKPQENLSLYASYAESFLPQSGDQFTVLSAISESLEPELFENLELGAKWAPHRDLLLSAAVFRLTRSNSTSIDAATGLTVLDGESRVEGFEAGLVGKPIENLSLSLGYTYLDGELTRSGTAGPAGRTLQQVPEHQVTAWGRYDVTDRFGVGAGVVHQSSQFASNSNAVVLPAYTRVDAALYFDVTDSLSLQLNVENLFDETYYASAHGDNNIQPGVPLNATLGARLRF